ncbi:MAG: hypothetical protein FVQ81_02150 [Candidatus Glassbacteria bacterium]|nr:hypothetical protein [Candidatus Glassbacteria bacterium]
MNRMIVLRERIERFFRLLHHRELLHLTVGFFIGFIPYLPLTILGIVFVLWWELRHDPRRWCGAKWLWRVRPASSIYSWRSRWLGGDRYLDMDIKGWLDLSFWINGILLGILLRILIF